MKVQAGAHLAQLVEHWTPVSRVMGHVGCQIEAQLIKMQKLILLFNLKTRKSKELVTISLFYLSPNLVFLPPGNLRMRQRLSAIPSCLIILSSFGIRGMYHYHLVSMAI